MAEAVATDTIQPTDQLRSFDRSKLALWIFLSSEVIFFTSLIAIFSIYVSRIEEIPKFDRSTIILVSINTFFLLLSSLMVVLGLEANRRGDRGRLKVFLGATLVLGIVFLSIQSFEYNQLITHEGITLSNSLYGTAFFMLTGFHGLHVLVGVLWLIQLLFFRILPDTITPGDTNPVEFFGLYWHFVDVVWIVVFTLVYLIG